MTESKSFKLLLKQAADVFTLAGKLGEAFSLEAEKPSRRKAISAWMGHAEEFGRLRSSLQALADSAKQPPAGFEGVAERLLQAEGIVREIDAVMATKQGWDLSEYRERHPALRTVCEQGRAAVKQAKVKPVLKKTEAANGKPKESGATVATPSAAGGAEKDVTDPAAKATDLGNLADGLCEEIDELQTSTLGELTEPSPIRERKLYKLVQAVERHYRGGLPLPVRWEWWGMLDRADDGRREPDPREWVQAYYDCCDRLCEWAEDELEVLQPEAERKGGPESPERAKQASHAAQLGEALVNLSKHPDWSTARIARTIGVHRSTLARWPEFRSAVKAISDAPDSRRPKGYHLRDADGGPNGVEAYAAPAGADSRAEASGRPVRPPRTIPGKCSLCGEPMGIAPDRMGMRNLCERCE